VGGAGLAGAGRDPEARAMNDAPPRGQGCRAGSGAAWRTPGVIAGLRIRARERAKPSASSAIAVAARAEIAVRFCKDKLAPPPSALVTSSSGWRRRPSGRCFGPSGARPTTARNAGPASSRTRCRAALSKGPGSESAAKVTIPVAAAKPRIHAAACSRARPGVAGPVSPAQGVACCDRITATAPRLGALERRSRNQVIKGRSASARSLSFY
jgi:hypothetical protein